MEMFIKIIKQFIINLFNFTKYHSIDIVLYFIIVTIF